MIVMAASKNKEADTDYRGLISLRKISEIKLAA